MSTAPRRDVTRPFGVILIALLFLMSSFLTLGILVLGVLQPEWVLSLHDLGGDIKMAADRPGAYFIVAGMYAAIALGLLRLQPWARLAVLFVTGVSLITAVAGIVLGIAIKPLTHGPVTTFLWFSAVLSGIIVLYFRQSHVKIAFRTRASRSTPEIPQ